MKRFGLAFLFSLWIGAASAQLAGGLMFPGPGTPASSVTYQGPGDGFAGATAGGSVATAYNAAYANGTNPLADLVAVTGGASVCTLRVATTGLVDLAASYCAGTTPTLACAAASGGSCKVTKVYDQTGNSNHCTNATLATMPALRFNAQNGLPTMDFVGGSNSVLSCLTSLTQAQPFTMSVAGERTAALTTGSFYLGAQGNGVGIGPSSGTANTISIYGTVNQAPFTASDSAFHATMALLSGVASAMNVDGTDAVAGLDPGTVGLSSILRVGRNNGGTSLSGSISEFWYWPLTSNSTNRNAVCHTQKANYGLTGTC